MLLLKTVDFPSIGNRKLRNYQIANGPIKHPWQITPIEVFDPAISTDAHWNANCFLLVRKQLLAKERFL